MSKKHYVVWKGQKTGIFDNWSEVQTLVKGMNNAQYMGFNSKSEAESAFKSTYTKALMKRSLASNNSENSKQTQTLSIPKSNTINYADINIYCDGACSPNPGKSGSGIALYKKETLSELWFGLYEQNGTNNTAELNALHQALKLAKTYNLSNQTVQILSDSKYSIDCITKWANGWQKKGWTRGKGEPIKNLSLIQHCFTLYTALKDNITINHVKGHANIEGNELSDRMAVLARMNAEKHFVKYEEAIDIQTILSMPSG